MQILQHNKSLENYDAFVCNECGDREWQYIEKSFI